MRMASRPPTSEVPTEPTVESEASLFRDQGFGIGGYIYICAYIHTHRALDLGLRV